MFRIAVSKTVRCLANLPQGSQTRLIPTRKVFTLDPDGYNQRQTPFASVQYFFQNTLPEVGFNSENEVTVMDVGCGQGLLTNQLILPMFPKVKKVLAMDLLPGMVEFAKTHYSHPKIEYSVADIEDWTTVARWEGSISKLFSIHSFHWVQNERQAFQNVLQLLHPGGEGAICMALQSQFYDAMLKISKDSKWRKFFQNVDNFIAVPHDKGHHAMYYKQIAEEVGFTVLHAEEKIRVDALPNDQVFRSFFSSVCVLVPHVPAERREEFKDDFVRYLLREGGRSSEGLPIHIGNMLELVVRKD